MKRPWRPDIGACYFSSLRDQIRYLADQWNFNGISAPINELKPPYQRKTIEFARAVKTDE